MSYEPTNWKSGDTITEERLNKIEQGIANSRVVTTLTVTEWIDYMYTKGSIDITWQDVHDCIVNGVPVYVFIHGESADNGYDGGTQIMDAMYQIIEAVVNGYNGMYVLYFNAGSEQIPLLAANADDYPALEGTEPAPTPGPEG